MYKVTISMPNLAEGATVELDGLGIFENGGVYEVTDTEAETFAQKHKIITTAFNKKGTSLRIELDGPNLSSAFDEVDGIEVEYIKEPTNA